MILEPLIAAVAVALSSLVGVFFFGDNRWLIGFQKHIVPIAVGVFLSLSLFELIPEALSLSPQYGGIAVALGFIGFYVLSSILHNKYHHLDEEECEKKGAAMLLLIGDAIHNMADGVILGGAFLVDPAIGFATALGLALHEIPQEIAEFGILIRAGFSRMTAALFNLLSASSIILGTLLIFVLAKYAEEYIWLLMGIAAGNLFYIAASDLLPRIHGDLKKYGSIWKSALSITLGFIVMTIVLVWTHEHFGHGHAHGEEHREAKVHEHDE